MKRFIGYIFLFFIALFIIDRLAGLCFDYLNSHAKGGDTANQYYICKQSDEDILIFGSSRANHHYVPSIIEDSLNMSCYNCGTDGNGILLHYGRYKLISERYTPKIIIYDLTDAFDILPNDNLKYLEQLKQYHDEANLIELFDDVSVTERYKLYSKLYQYNTKFIQMLGDNIKPQQQTVQGYKPLLHVMDYEPDNRRMGTNTETDSIKLKYLEKFIIDTKQKGIKLVFIISPYYRACSSDSYKPAKMLTEKYDVPLWDFYADKRYNTSKDYFSDSSHLNDTGARIFTKRIISRLRNTTECRTYNTQQTYQEILPD